MCKLYELEQQILETWGLIDDLRILLEVVDGDRPQNILIGLIDLYEIKFQKLFNNYEQVVAAC
jgi:hypothetical protein